MEAEKVTAIQEEGRGAGRQLRVAASQFACTDDEATNIASATRLIEQAAQEGVQLLLLQELFGGFYFCKQEVPAFFDRARPAHLEHNTLLRHMSQLAAQHRMILPVSFFERAGPAYYNSVVVFDADGTLLGLPSTPGEPGDCQGAVYRKMHIPTGPGYQEKFYFSPGPALSSAHPEGGFRVYTSRVYGVTLGVGICWDQWFPETARCLALLGAEILLYPTAIGSEPQDPSLHSRDHWQTAMRGHAASNLMPVVASNRIGTEDGQRFYGSSFICDGQGRMLQEADETSETLLTHLFDLEALRQQRASWGLFRDRRPEAYGLISGLHSSSSSPVARVAQSVRSEAPPAGYAMPAEWETHERCWMIWPAPSPDVWSPHALARVREEWAQVARAIRQFEPLSMLVAPDDEAHARTLLGDDIAIVPVAHDDCWARDSLPTFIKHPLHGTVAGVDWVFNGYSHKFPHDHDARLARTVLSMAGKARVGSPLILEGGSIHVDGEGTLLTTEECLLKRNPLLSKEDIEQQLRWALGVQVIIWLPLGVMYDDDTDGHVDNICCFARPGEVVLTYPSDPSSFQRARSEQARQILEQATDARGRKLRVHLLEHPRPLYVAQEELVEGLREAERPLAGSYVNYYLANGGVVMPSYEDGAGHDAVAQAQLQAIYPDRVVVSVPSRSILCGGGNIHCITQQQPL